MSFLDDIVGSTESALEARMRSRPFTDVKRMVRDVAPARDFSAAIRRKDPDRLRLIAEIKQASPSKGLLRSAFDPAAIAAEYEESGASAVSILTESHFFRGAPEHIEAARKSTRLPILRKDFLLTEYQVYESRAVESDAILLIVKLLDNHQLKGFSETAAGLGMSCLVEVHSASELQRCLKTGMVNVGINNRNLNSFETDLNVTFRLVKDVPKDRTVVSESGISTPADIERLNEAGVHAVLIGETFMKSPDIGAKIRELFGKDFKN